MRIVIVADESRQRMALSDTIHKINCHVCDCLTSERLLFDILPTAAIWLIDCDNYTPQMQARVMESKPKSVLLGFKPAPYMSDIGAYDRWQRQLIRCLGQILGMSFEDKADDKTDKSETKADPTAKNWKYVLFLGASMGGPEAIKQFLDNLSPNLPLTVLIAHHFDETMIAGLPQILTRHNGWRCKLITTSQRLQAGVCLLAPIDKQIVCDSTGRVILTKKPWQGEYRPNIGTLLKNASDVFGSELIAIIFSGMGNDGSQHAKELTVNNSLLWAQDPTTCQSPSQSQAFIDTGVCQFIGSPELLAQRLSRLLAPYLQHHSCPVGHYSRDKR